MSTRSGRIRPKVADVSPPRTRKRVSPSRSPGRSRKSSPPAQPRTKSPSRKSPSRKSPNRSAASKYPARKSPSRTTKGAAESAPKSPGKRQPVKSDLKVKLNDISKLDFRPIRTRRSEYSVKDVQHETTNLDQNDRLNGMDLVLGFGDGAYGLRHRQHMEEVLPRRSGRLRDFTSNLPDIRRSLSKSTSKSLSKSVSQSLDFSDGDNSEEDSIKTKSESLESVTRKLHTPLRESVGRLAQVSRWEFGGRIGSAVLLLLLPATIFSILISCSKSCSARNLLNLSAYKSWLTWFSWDTLAVVTAQTILQAALSLVPILGTKADRMDESGTKAYFNAFFSSIFTVNVLFTLNYLNLFSSQTLLNNYLRLAVTSYIFSVVLSIILYVKSRKLDDSELNPYGNTGYKLYDFFMGREIHPFIKNLDVKIWLSRIANISTLILSVLIFQQGISFPTKAPPANLTTENFKEYLSKVQLKPTLLIFSFMQIIYILNFIMKEHKITTTFFWQSEGVGYLQCVASALYPFFFTTISKYVADSQLALPTNALIAASVLFVLGFILMLISNNIKHAFRTNPLQPGISNLVSMPTFHGKKLLVSHMWGILRHPNYTGDILMHITLALPGILSKQYIAAAPALLTILVLLHRSWRDHSRCRRRYGAAWERYCKRVPSVIIPKVL